MREAVIVSAARTPVGRCRGALASVPAHELGAAAVKAAVERAGIDPSKIDDVIFANLMNNEINNMGRMVGLAAGLPITVPGITLDRQCAASLNAFAFAAALIIADQGDIFVAGGVESDSRRTYSMDKPTNPYQVAPPSWSKILTAPESFGTSNMVETAQNLADKYNLTREELDQFAVISHQKAAKAQAAGIFKDQIVPIQVSQGKGKFITVDQDECVRADTTLETLAKLPPVSRKDGVVTAGNSSPMSDGAGAVIVMEKSLAKAMGLKILGKFKAYTAAGVEPHIMGIGPVAAVQKIFAKTGMGLDDIDLIEMNEAFAAQSIPCIKELKMPLDKLNVNGGALALGHPLAGTGGILLTKMVYELERSNKSTGLITFCVGGGQGVAVIIERE